MKITNVNIYGLSESLVVSGYPMRTCVSDKIQPESEIVHSATLERAERLGNCPQGSGHDTFLKGIIVQFDIDFTIKAWTEAQRYHWFDFVSSCSTMHKLKDFDLDKAYIKYVDPWFVEQMKTLQKIYNDNPTRDNFLRLVYSNPCGMKLTARMTTNYLQLKTMYAQRKDHRLPEWAEWCEWVKSLPYTRQLGVYK